MTSATKEMEGQGNDSYSMRIGGAPKTAVMLHEVRVFQ